MRRNIVVCCDGTNSQFGTVSTNVVHLYNALIDDDPMQEAFYEPGVGTFGARFFGVDVGTTLGKTLGAAFGYGIQQNLIRAYRFIVGAYKPGDRLFIFGFSRGAFTARTLAGLVDVQGVLDNDERELSARMVKAYLQHGKKAADTIVTSQPVTTCAPYFVGVWETVSALGVLIRLRRFHDHCLSPSVTRAVQALAIDERRGPFKPSLWNEHTPADRQRITQAWFAGVHSDVGGGYARRGLADITLGWMLEQAEAAGLMLRPDADRGCQADPEGQLHRSYYGAWRLLGEHVRRPGANARFHPSVTERMARVPGYDPRNIPAFVRRTSRTCV